MTSAPATGPDEPVKKKSAAKVKVDPTAPLHLRWELHDLPTSQHKAGLAGLALSVRFLARKTGRKGVCEIEAIDDHSLTLLVNSDGMQSLFDDIYAAEHVDVLVKAKWKDVEPRDEISVEVKDDKTGKTRTEKRFVYSKVQPVGGLLADQDKGAANGTKYWLKLWQELVWTSLRGVPATREPYNARAESRIVTDGADAWLELATKPLATVALPSTYALGAQAMNAENVAFKDIARLRLLLHFWPFVVAIYVPQTIDRDGKRANAGYALAVPDVARLQAFVDDCDAIARERNPEPQGYVPRDAIIDMAAEAGLDVVRRSEALIAGRQGSSQLRFWLTAVDVFHIEKDGNNIRLRNIARVMPSRQMVDEYALVRRAEFWSPVFRHQRIANVVNEQPWWFGYGRLCAVTPQGLTIDNKFFRRDARVAMKETEMKQETGQDLSIEHLVYRRVQAYVLGKTERKYDLTWGTAKGNPAKEEEFGKRKEKVAKEAFLAVRSRTGADFVSYFTSTICSVPHHVGEPKFLELARALLDPKDVEKVRSLTLLALSAI